MSKFPNLALSAALVAGIALAQPAVQAQQGSGNPQNTTNIPATQGAQSENCCPAGGAGGHCSARKHHHHHHHHMGQMAPAGQQ
jgi:hypothetical protein